MRQQLTGSKEKTEMSINDTIAAMLEEFPGWEWLVRSDGQGAFANFHAPDIVDWTADGETCFPCWSDTPENALSASLEWAKEFRTGPGLLSDSMLRTVDAKRRESLAAFNA
jgi:hypothetical protein